MNDQVTSRRRSGAVGQPYLNNLVSAVSAPAMSLSARSGQIRPFGAEGLYVHDLRALSRLEVTVDGVEPFPLGYELCGGASNQFDSSLLPGQVMVLRLCLSGGGYSARQGWWRASRSGPTRR